MEGEYSSNDGPCFSHKRWRLANDNIRKKQRLKVRANILTAYMKEFKRKSFVHDAVDDEEHLSWNSNVERVTTCIIESMYCDNGEVVMCKDN